MNDKIKALVLNINDYKENDMMLQVISEDKGFLSLVAKSANKLSAKHHFNNLCVYEFMIDYKDNKTIYSIHGSKLISSFYEDNNLTLLTFKNILIEMCLKVKELYDEDLYKNTVFSLEKIKENNMYLIGSLYTSYLLKINGISPVVDKCVVCGNEKVTSISKELGGFLCIEHKGLEDVLDVSNLKKFRLINKASFSNYEAIKDIEFNKVDFDIIMDFLVNNSDLNFKSYKLFNRLFQKD